MGGSSGKTLALIAGIIFILFSNSFGSANISWLLLGLALAFAAGWGGTAREAGWLGALMGAPLGLSVIFRFVREINLLAGGDFYIHADAVLIAAMTAAPLAAGAGALLSWGLAKTALRLLPLLNHVEN